MCLQIFLARINACFIVNVRFSVYCLKASLLDFATWQNVQSINGLPFSSGLFQCGM